MKKIIGIILTFIITISNVIFVFPGTKITIKSKSFKNINSKENILELYKGAILQKDEEFQNRDYLPHHPKYTLYDIDKNGIPELIIESASGLGYRIYTVENNLLKECGEISAYNSQLYEYQNGNGIICCDGGSWGEFISVEGLNGTELIDIEDETVSDAASQYEIDRLENKLKNYKQLVFYESTDLSYLNDTLLKKYYTREVKVLLKNDVEEKAITIILNGTELSFNEAPYIENGTTMVPMRAIFEALGASVDYDSNTETIIAQKNDTTTMLIINSYIAKVNDVEKTLSSAVVNKNGSTMIPLRFVSEAFNAQVNWNEAERKITIDLN